MDRTGLGDTVVVAGSYEVTPPWRTAGGSTGHYEDNTTRVRQPDTGSNPTHRNWLCGPWQVFERLTGDVAFQTAHDLSGG